MVRGLLLCLLLLAGHAVSFADGEALPYRIAVVNMVVVLEQAPQAAAEGKRLEELYAGREQALKQEQIELQQLQEKFRQSADTLSQDVRVQNERELRALQRDYSRKVEDLREEIRIAKDAALEKVQEQVEQAVEAVRAQGQIDVVFRESDYIVASARVNVTDKVLAHLQQQFDKEQEQQAGGKPTSGE